MAFFFLNFAALLLLLLCLGDRLGTLRDTISGSSSSPQNTSSNCSSPAGGLCCAGLLYLGVSCRPSHHRLSSGGAGDNALAPSGSLGTTDLLSSWLVSLSSSSDVSPYFLGGLDCLPDLVVLIGMGCCTS